MSKRTFVIPERVVRPRLTLLALRIIPQQEVELEDGKTALTPRRFGAAIKGADFPEGKLKEELNVQEVLSKEQRRNLNDIVDALEAHAFVDAGLVSEV